MLDPIENMPLPRPILERECECGCGHTFQPERKDKIYLNKQHADYAYNHGKRKKNNRIRNTVVKILSNNDRILGKHFIADAKVEQKGCYFDVIKADGFNFSYHIGVKEVKNIKYYYTYNYCFNIYSNDNIKMVKIFKR